MAPHPFPLYLFISSSLSTEAGGKEGWICLPVSFNRAPKLLLPHGQNTERILQRRLLLLLFFWIILCLKFRSYCSFSCVLLRCCYLYSIEVVSPLIFFSVFLTPDSRLPKCAPTYKHSGSFQCLACSNISHSFGWKLDVVATWHLRF